LRSVCRAFGSGAIRRLNHLCKVSEQQGLQGFKRDPRLGKFYTRLHDAVNRVYDAAGNVIEAHEHKGDFKEP
jgi:hypothetical protein